MRRPAPGPAQHGGVQGNGAADQLRRKAQLIGLRHRVRGGGLGTEVVAGLGLHQRITDDNRGGGGLAGRQPVIGLFDLRLDTGRGSRPCRHRQPGHDHAHPKRR